jgi:hypothetical protein
MIYTKGNAVLALKINNRKIEWLKYVLLNQVVANDYVPKRLLISYE